jgi:hypothetical protein
MPGPPTFDLTLSHCQGHGGALYGACELLLLLLICCCIRFRSSKAYHTTFIEVVIVRGLSLMCLSGRNLTLHSQLHATFILSIPATCRDLLFCQRAYACRPLFVVRHCRRLSSSTSSSAATTPTHEPCRGMTCSRIWTGGAGGLRGQIDVGGTGLLLAVTAWGT